ncbi:MAG: helix-turn-helix domain-containing protein [Halanaerobiales bacterium]
MDNFNKMVGEKLRNLRNEKNLSLSELEKLTGVSKSMLGQVERGISSPTVKTLWKIARGLNVSFSTFVEEDSENYSVVSPENITPFIEKGENYRVYPLFPFEKKKGFEIYFIEIAPGYSHHAEAHYTGVEEYLLLKEGRLEVNIDDRIYQLKEGEALNFKGNKQHVYTNPAATNARAFTVIYYG